MRRPVPPALLVILPIALALVAWLPSALARDFAFDDREAILGNPVVEGSLPALEAFRRDYWHHLGDAGHYRPLASLSLRADYARFGTWPVGYHLVNVLLHTVVVGLASLLAVLHLKRPRPVLLGLAVFAAHPALADAVAWISGRTSMLGLLGPLVGGLLVVLALRLGSRLGSLCAVCLGSALGLALGLFGKEEAILFAPFFALLAASRSRSSALASLLGSGLGLAFYLILRAQALGSAMPSAPYAPLRASSLVERLLISSRALVEALRLSVAPFHFPPNYRSTAGFSPQAPPGSWAWIGWLLFAALALWAGRMLWRQRGRPGGRARAFTTAAIGLLFSLGAWVPYAQVIPAGEVFAPRFLYLPLFFAAPLFGLGLARLNRFVVAMLLLGLCLGAWTTKAAYHDREAYARAVLRFEPMDAAAWNDLGLALEERGDLEGAAEAWSEGLMCNSHHARIWSNLGRHQMTTGQLHDAEISLRKAVRYSTRNPFARCHLGALLLRLESNLEAAAVYGEATRIAPGLGPAWRGLANAHLRLGNYEACREALARALQLDPADGLSQALKLRLDKHN